MDKSARRCVIAGVAVLAVFWMIAQFTPSRGAVPGKNPFRARAAGRPLVIAHAGGLGLNPGNTLEAFAASVALGCDMLEMDVRLTKDGVLVTHHDATLEQTSDGFGAVIDHTLAELKALNFGYYFQNESGMHTYRDRIAHLATVEELFQRYGSVGMVIELKDSGEAGRRAAEALAALIAKNHVTNSVLVASFKDTTLDAFRNITRRRTATSCAIKQTRNFVLLGLLRLDHLWNGGVEAVQVPSNPRKAYGFRLATPGFIRKAHARNMAVHFWTVNETDEMIRLIEMGADGLITDYPDRLQKALALRR